MPVPASCLPIWSFIGIPHRVVIGDKGLDDGTVEYKGRRDAETTFVPLDEIVSFLFQRLRQNDAG